MSTKTPTKKQSPTVLPKALLTIVCIPGDNPRKDFGDDEGEGEALAWSMQEDGIYQPIVVMEIPEGRASAFRERARRRHPDDILSRLQTARLPTHVIVAGERRWRAAITNATEYLPAMVYPYDAARARRIGIVENVHRKPLSSWDLADFLSGEFVEMKKESASVTQADLARRFGLTQGYVSNLLRLLELPEDLQVLVRERRLNGVAAVLLGRVENRTMRRHFLSMLVAGNCTHRDWMHSVRDYVDEQEQRAGRTSPGRSLTRSGGVRLTQVYREKTGATTFVRHSIPPAYPKKGKVCICHSFNCPVHGLVLPPAK